MGDGAGLGAQRILGMSPTKPPRIPTAPRSGQDSLPAPPAAFGSSGNVPCCPHRVLEGNPGAGTAQGTKPFPEGICNPGTGSRKVWGMLRSWERLSAVESTWNGLESLEILGKMGEKRDFQQNPLGWE